MFCQVILTPTGLKQGGLKLRTIWKGAISFGLVHIPVKLFSAAESKSLKFNYIHNECKSPVNYKKYCSVCNREVAADEIVRGFEYEKGKFVILNEEDLDKLPTKTTKTIDIIDFVNLTEIDPIYFSKPYYLAPGEGGQKAYVLLKEAMEQTKKIAIAKVTIRSTENLVCLRVFEKILMMESMYYPDEIRPIYSVPELNVKVELHENEIKMANELINNLSGKFEPEKYKSDYREELAKLVEAKITGQQIEIPQTPDTGRVIDLMEALKASLEATNNERKTSRKETSAKEECSQIKNIHDQFPN